MTQALDLAAIAVAHRERGFHPFPVDHPGQPQCIGKHGPSTPCDGQRGKHPAVKWKVWSVAATPQMIADAWAQRGGLANIGIACGPSNLVVLDEDAPGELDRWAVTYGLVLPVTYTVITGRGRHLYYRWDHSRQRIGNVETAFDGFKINVRGDGGLVVAVGSLHASGVVYTDNGAAVADLPENIAALLLAGAPHDGGASDAFWDGPARDPNATMIADGERHNALVAYAGRLRAKGLDYPEAETLFRARWELCEQPESHEPQAKFHTPTCRYPVTWQEAVSKLTDVYNRYAAGAPEAAVMPQTPPADWPRLWAAVNLKQATAPRWLASGRIPFGQLSLLVGDEGIGKSLLWTTVAASVTTGRALPEFGIPAREPAPVIVVVTEDDWGSVVRPRLEVAGADLGMMGVICTADDGSGAPEFPRDIGILHAASPPPALVVVDAWVDTLPARLSVKDPQQARQALHPWKELATATDAAVLLLTHTNRVASASARDRYGATGELRKKARLTLYAQADEEGRLVVGPEKANTTRPVAASVFKIEPIPYFPPSVDHDGTVPVLAYVGDSDRTARQLIADAHEADQGDDRRERAAAEEWLREYLELEGPGAISGEVKRAAKAAGLSERTLARAREKLGVVFGWTSTKPSRTTWSLPTSATSPLVGTGGTASIVAGREPMPHLCQPPSESEVGTGLAQAGTGTLSCDDADAVLPVPPVPLNTQLAQVENFVAPTGPGRCTACGYHVATMKHRPDCPQQTSAVPS